MPYSILRLLALVRSSKLMLVILQALVGILCFVLRLILLAFAFVLVVFFRYSLSSQLSIVRNGMLFLKARLIWLLRVLVYVLVAFFILVILQTLVDELIIKSELP